MCFRWPVTTFARGSGEKTRGRQNRTSRVREIQRSLLIFSLDLDGSRQVALSASKCLFNNHQLPSLDCKQAFAPRTQIYSWNESKARFRQLVGASVAQRRDGACQMPLAWRFLQHKSARKGGSDEACPSVPWQPLQQPDRVRRGSAAEPIQNPEACSR